MENIDILQSIVIKSAGAVLGAVILPLGASLVGGYGMIAAAGALIACVDYALPLALASSASIIFSFMSDKYQAKILKSITTHPLLSQLVILLLEQAALFYAAYGVSIVIGQPFIPLSLCMFVGFLIITGIQLIKEIYNAISQNKESNNLDNYQAARI